MDTKNQGYFDSSFANISYIYVPNPGPVVTFIHGNSACKEIFQKQFSALSLNYHLLAWDLPGHGQSSNSKKENPSDCYTMINYAKCLKELFTHLKIDKAVLVGNSLGGHIALNFMDLYPDSVLGAVITGTPPVNNKDDIGKSFKFDQPAGRLSNQIKQFSKEESELFFGASGFPLTEHFIFDAGIRTDGIARSEMIKSFVGESDGLQRDIFENSKVPILVIIGTEDAFINADYFNELKHTQMHKFVNMQSGHALFFGDFEEFNKILEDFLKSLSN
jgi:pimeloyl-ACP methyl ester carboxylesterase